MIRDVGNIRDRDGVLFSGKAMMGRGMELKLNGKCKNSVVSSFAGHYQKVQRKS